MILWFPDRTTTRMGERSVVRRAAIEAGVELSHRLGSGGQGEVWAVHRRETLEPLALKIVRRRSPAEREAFEREARVGTFVGGITLVRTVAVVRKSRWGALLQERVNGVSLAVLFALVEEPWPIAARAQLAITLLEAVAQLHRAGWVHADVAPHNVLVERGGRLRMVDYGAARPIGQHADAVLGREEFMAPEQRHGAALTPATDVYAVGRVLAAMRVDGSQYTTLGGSDDVTREDCDLCPQRSAEHRSKTNRFLEDEHYEDERDEGIDNAPDAPRERVGGERVDAEQDRGERIDAERVDAERDHGEHGDDEPAPDDWARSEDPIDVCIRAMTRTDPRARPSVAALLDRFGRLAPSPARLAWHAHRCLGPVTPCPDIRALNIASPRRRRAQKNRWRARWSLAIAAGLVGACTLRLMISS